MPHAAQVEELRLEQVKMSREKEVIENQLEAEQEYIVNKLQKQAMGLAAEKQALQGEKADLKRQVQAPCRAAAPDDSISCMGTVADSSSLAPPSASHRKVSFLHRWRSCRAPWRSSTTTR